METRGQERQTVHEPALTVASGMRYSSVSCASFARRNVLYCIPPDGNTCAHIHIRTHTRTGSAECAKRTEPHQASDVRTMLLAGGSRSDLALSAKESHVRHTCVGRST
jgi:hypothetical protein